MSRDESQHTDIHATISGPVTGQVAVGTNIRQTQGASTEPVTEEDLRRLKALFGELRARVETAAPPESKPAALERVDELEQAATAAVPDLTTMEYVSRWFTTHLPAIAGSVISLVVHPVIGKLVGAAGDAAVAEFQRRFGKPQS